MIWRADDNDGYVMGLGWKQVSMKNNEYTLQGVLLMIIYILLHFQLISPDHSERQWICYSLSHLIMEEDKVNLLINNGLINNIKMLMIEDPVWCVRGAAAGVMRYTIFSVY